MLSSILEITAFGSTVMVGRSSSEMRVKVAMTVYCGRSHKMQDIHKKRAKQTGILQHAHTHFCDVDDSRFFNAQSRETLNLCNSKSHARHIIIIVCAVSTASLGDSTGGEEGEDLLTASLSSGSCA